MKFVETDSGLVNLSLVREIKKGADDTAAFYWDGGQASSQLNYYDFTASLGEVVPDHTGAKAVFFSIQNGVVSHQLQPIVAWCVHDGAVSPIVIGGAEVDYVQYADESVHHLYSDIFKNIDEAAADYLKHHQGILGT